MAKAIARHNTTAVAVNSKDRAKFIITRLKDLTKELQQGFIETGQLLKEFMDNALYKEQGYKSFNEAIDGMQAKGELDFGARNARNMINVATMVSSAQLSAKDLQAIPVSSLREIATLPPKEQQKLLPNAKDMSVAEIQEKCKAIRHKVKGHDVDPYDPIIFKDATATAKTALNEAIARARQLHRLPETMPDFAVLVDVIVAEWSASSEACSYDIDGEVVSRS